MPKKVTATATAAKAPATKFFLALVPTGTESNKVHLQFSVVGRPAESAEEAEAAINRSTDNPSAALVVTVEVPE